MFDLLHDLQTTLRALRRRPLYPIVAVSILALGLGASIAVFTYVNAFYQPFPGVDTEGLVRVFGADAEETYQDVSYLDFLDYAGAQGAFEGIAAVQPYYAASVRLESMTDVAFLEAVSGDYFSVLGIETHLGRGIAAQDDRPEAQPVAVLSHEWWQNRFGGDPTVLGRTIYLNYRPFTVAGVAAPAFLGSTADSRPQVWVPIAPFRDRYTRWAAFAEDREVPLVRVYARLRDGASEEQGLAELTAMATGLDDLYPRKNGATRQIVLDEPTWIDPRSRLEEWSTVRLMSVAAGGLLLLVCANVANLLLSVAVRRQRETAVRAALGASPGRLVKQVLLENVVLAGLAGSVALFLAKPSSMRLGEYFARPSVWGSNVAREAVVDLRVVLFALAVAVLTGALAGLLPASRVWRRDLALTLKSDADGESSSGAADRIWGWRLPFSAWWRRRAGVRDLLVSVQVALCVVLLVVAGLVLRTLATAQDLDPGFSYDQLMVTHISTSSTDLEVEERDLFFRDLAARLAEEPWVHTASVADFPLLSRHASADLVPDGQSEPVPLVFSKVIPGFFAALDIEVRQGRAFRESDTAGSRDVAVINEALARRFFAGENPLGRRVVWPESEDGTRRSYEIVGVVKDTKTQDFLAEPPPTVYFSYPQHRYPTGSALMVAVKGNPQASVPQLNRWLRDFEPHLAIINVVTYRDVVRGLLYTHRMNAEMFSVLAFLALILSAIGIWSVVSLAVSRRTREIAVRMAIGAERGDVIRLILSRSLASVAAGLVLGLAVSSALTGWLRSLLYGVEPTDPLALAAGTTVLIVTALSAAYLPARRAATVDPKVFLRHE